MSDNEGDSVQQVTITRNNVACPSLYVLSTTHTAAAGAAANRCCRSGQQVSRHAEQVWFDFYVTYYWFYALPFCVLVRRISCCIIR
jgi:hypothetical protein